MNEYQKEDKIINEYQAEDKIMNEYQTKDSQQTLNEKKLMSRKQEY